MRKYEYFSFIKVTVKKILNYFGWRIIKINYNRKIEGENQNPEYVKCLMNCNGILHIGAHRGMEGPIYNWFNKKVLWIEANPKIYEELKINISHFRDQKAFNYLITDKDNSYYDFNISSNDAASSSIFNFGEEHKNYNNKKFDMIDKINIKSITLENFFFKHQINYKDYNFWIIDVQGAELMVLKGAKNTIKNCDFIYLEISKKEFYKNGVLFQELNNWLVNSGFKKVWEPTSNHTNVLFKRI